MIIIEFFKWVPVSTSQAANVKGVIKVGPANMNVARIKITLANGTFTTIGKVWSGKIFYHNPATEKEIYTIANVEVLACQPCANGGRGQFI
jgi:hypothetical protein